MRAGAIVIGAGVMGASVAYHLARGGVRNVVVLERQPRAGLGSTGRATGGFRALFGTEINVRLSLLSRQKLQRFPHEIDADSGLAPHGYLLLARTDEALEAASVVVELASAWGVEEARVVDRAEIARLNPAIETDDVVGGVFSAGDGFIRPLAILEGYLGAAEALGVEVRYDTGALLPHVANGRVAGVAERGARAPVLEAERVVIACGAWSGELGRRSGIDIPVVPERRQVAITEPFDHLPEEMPMTIDLEDGFHLRVRDGRVLLLLPRATSGENALDPYDTTFDASWLPHVVQRAHARVPCLERAQIDLEACWAGLYEVTPDGHVLLGEHPDVKGLYLATGGSGHGVMHAPAIGQLSAEIVTDGVAHTVDVSALRVSRFREGDPIEGNALL